MVILKIVLGAITAALTIFFAGFGLAAATGEAYGWSFVILCLSGAIMGGFVGKLFVAWVSKLVDAQ